MSEKYNYNSDDDVFDREETKDKREDEVKDIGRGRKLTTDIIFIVVMLSLALVAFIVNYKKEMLSSFTLDGDSLTSSLVITELIVNINTADKYELMQLKGIGEVLAERIIEYRETYGAFDYVQDIVKVEGISENLFERLYLNLTV